MAAPSSSHDQGRTTHGQTAVAADLSRADRGSGRGERRGAPRPRLAQPKKGGTLTLGRNHDADTFYPGRSTGLSAIATNLLLYEGLVLHDFSMKIRPALGERWEVSGGGLTWTFHLDDQTIACVFTELHERQLEQRLVGEAVVVPVQHIRWIFGSRPRVQGMKYHPIHGVSKLMDTWMS